MIAKERKSLRQRNKVMLASRTYSRQLDVCMAEAADTTKKNIIHILDCFVVIQMKMK